MNEITYIVLDLDGGEMLTRCLQSIDSQTGVARRILVVDNGSPVPVASRLPLLDSPLEQIRFEENRGFAGGVNAGLTFASSSFVALINNDVLLDPSWSTAMLEAVAQPQVAAAQSIIAAPDGTIDGAGIGIEAGRFVQIAHGRPAKSIVQPMWGVSATAALYRREALESVRTSRGIMDERFFAYFEDVELAARLIAAGWSFARVDVTLAVHAGSASAHRLGAKSEFLRTRNRYYVQRLHPGTVRRSSLIHEDLRRGTRLLLRGELSRAITIARGMLRGVSDRLEVV